MKIHPITELFTSQRRAVSGLALSMLLASLGTSIANIALPDLQVAFAAPFREVQLVVIAYLGTLTISVVMAGRFGDRHGMKQMLILGLSIFMIASISCAVAPSLFLVMFARGVQGVGAAFMMTLSMALMRQISDSSRIGRAMGLLGSVSALGTALGPSVGGILVSEFGWRSIFWFQVPLAAAALVLTAKAFPSGKKTRSVAFGLSMLARERGLMPRFLLNLVVAAMMMTTLVVGPFYLSLGLGLRAGLVGIVMAVGPMISIFSGLPSGRLVDMIGSHRTATLGLWLVTAGASMLALLPNLIGITGYLGAIVILTPGYQLFQAANNTEALADVPAEQRGIVSGLLTLSRNLGLIAGASGMGSIFAFAVGTQDLGSAPVIAIQSGMQTTFAMAAGMMFLATVLNFQTRRYKR